MPCPYAVRQLYTAPGARTGSLLDNRLDATRIRKGSHSALVSTLFAANSRNITPPDMATVRCEMRIASSCPPITAAPCTSSTHGSVDNMQRNKCK